jgi:hypothetical protein
MSGKSRLWSYGQLRLRLASQARVIDLAMKHRIAAIFTNPFAAREGALIGHGRMAGARIPEIAVETLITKRPPHRTERAPFGHSAPTSGI